jgi:NAD(P)-dependent dehydrogenase (short-subunit alcohol dehydrogenase family)
MISTLVDTLLELSVVGSFSRMGSTIRRRLDGWTAPPAGAFAGRTVVLTGPTSGLGRAMADRLAALGARLVLLGRDPERLAAVRDELAGAYGAAAAEAVVTDMASLASVRAAVDTILESESRIDVVIDNAGAIFAERETTEDGLEATFATMVAGPFALVSGLLPRLRTTPGARVIAVTSGGMYAEPLDLDDLGWERRPWNGTRAYAQAKRAQVALIREWARRVPASDVAFTAMHPGWAATPGLAAALPGFAGLMAPLLRSAEEGIDTAVWLAALPAPAFASGQLFLDRRPRPFDRVPWTRVPSSARRRLWDAVARLAGVSDPAPDSGPSTPSSRHLAHGAHR